MADPVEYIIPIGEWVKVAKSKKTITLHNKDPRFCYSYTYREAGGNEPTDIDEGSPLFQNGERDTLIDDVKIDIYVTCRCSYDNRLTEGRIKADA